MRGRLPVGFKSGKLTVLEDNGCRNVTCRCACGTVRTYIRSNVANKLSKSCGCVGRKKTIARNKKMATHRASRSRLYNIYRSMLKRCYLPTCKDYQRYGARGVTVCDEWRNDPVSFIEWSKTHGYRDDLTIDRIAMGNSPYSPDNCRWITIRQQNNNRKSNTRISFKGIIYTLAEFARRIGVSEDLVQQRYKRGWTPEQLFNHPYPFGPGQHLLPIKHRKDTTK